MAGGGEESAAFRALKEDAEKALPKIAEKHADLVESAVEKGTRNIADHAANESELAEAFRSHMPKDTASFNLRTSEGTASDTTASLSRQATGSSRIRSTLEPDTAAADAGPAVPRFGRDALRDGLNFNDEIDREMKVRGLNRAEHDRLRVSASNNLTDGQFKEVAGVRDTIRIGEGQMITKVLGKDKVDLYLANAEHLPNGRPFQADRFQGSVARGTDTAGLTTPARLRDALALDDRGQNWSPVPAGASEAYQLRMAAPAGMEAETSYGSVENPALAEHVAELTGQSKARPWSDPFTGTGYTAGGVPEWQAEGTYLPDRAEIWKMMADGRETMVGYYDGERWTRVGE